MDNRRSAIRLRQPVLSEHWNALSDDDESRLSSSKKRRYLIDDFDDLAAAFGAAVTAPSEDVNLWVARKGEGSLYNALLLIIAKIQCSSARDHFKAKLSESAFNKILQSRCGFRGTRTRKKLLSSLVGNWLFSNRRWLDPRNLRDIPVLIQNFEYLRHNFHLFEDCSIAVFSSMITRASIAWHGIDPFPGCHSLMAEQPSQSHFLSTNALGCNDGETIQPFALRDVQGIEILHESQHPKPRHPLTSENSISSSFCFTSDFSARPETVPQAVQGLNAGEVLDMALDAHWTNSRTLKIEASELEEFARSASL